MTAVGQAAGQAIQMRLDATDAERESDLDDRERFTHSSLRERVRAGAYFTLRVFRRMKSIMIYWPSVTVVVK